jgi:hypothetical protein
MPGHLRSVDQTDFTVELPSGGTLHVQSPNEVELWETALARYREEYQIVKMNDLVTLGALLQQHLILYRCQWAVNGMEPETDRQGVPTGRYRRVEMKASDLAAYQKTLTEAAKEMRALEKSLGIDRATREAGGAHTVDSYLTTLKRAAHQRGIHITKRTLAYEAFVNEARWRVRMLFHADAEDRAYHKIDPKAVLTWVYHELQRLEQVDKDFAHERGKLYLGRL